MTVRNVVLKKKTMIIGKDKLKLFKKYTVWFDPYCEEYYVILKKYGSKVTIRFIADPYREELVVRIQDCSYDTFVKKLSSLEIELL